MQITIVPIPVVFYKYGYRIRMKSALIRKMQKEKERLEGKRKKGAERREKEREGLERVESGLV